MSSHLEDQPTVEISEDPTSGAEGVDLNAIRPKRSRNLNRVLGLTVAIMVIITAVLSYIAWQEVVLPQEPKTAAEAAIAKLEAEMALNPSDPLLHFRLVDAYFGIEKYDEATDALNDIIDLGLGDAYNAQAMYGLGRIEEAKGNTDAAVASYLEVLEIQELSEVQYALSRAYEALGDLDNAIEHLERYVELDSGQAGAKRNLAALYERDGDTERALELYQEAARFLPDDAEIAAALVRLGATE